MSCRLRKPSSLRFEHLHTLGRRRLAPQLTVFVFKRILASWNSRCLQLKFYNFVPLLPLWSQT